MLVAGDTSFRDGATAPALTRGVAVGSATASAPEPELEPLDEMDREDPLEPLGGMELEDPPDLTARAMPAMRATQANRATTSPAPPASQPLGADDGVGPTPPEDGLGGREGLSNG